MPNIFAGRIRTIGGKRRARQSGSVHIEGKAPMEFKDLMLPKELLPTDPVFVTVDEKTGKVLDIKKRVLE